jgi:hypothetical protein
MERKLASMGKVEAREEPKEVESNLLRTSLRILISLNGFNSATFISRCKNETTSLQKCLDLWSAGVRQYLDQPLKRRKSLTETAANYLDLTFLTLFSTNAAETGIYEKKRDRVLEASRSLNEETDINKFWQDYCHNYLEFEVKTEVAEETVFLLNRAWNEGYYPTLDLLDYLRGHKPTYNINAPNYSPGSRSLSTEMVNFDQQELAVFIMELNPRLKWPEFMAGNNSAFILNKNLSAALGFCFRETYYPTPEGLVTIPYDAALALALRTRLAEMTRIQKNPVDQRDLNLLLETFVTEIRNVEKTLSRFLYSML